MKGKKVVNLTLSTILATTSISAVSCTPKYIGGKMQLKLAQEVKNEDYVAGFEGIPALSLNKIGTLVENLSLNPTITGCATSGNPKSHLEYIRKAHENGNNIYIVGFSAGAKDALALAKLCKERNIPIKTMYLLDPTCFKDGFTGKIPDNVKEVINRRSFADNWVRGKPITSKNLEDKTTLIKNIEVLKVGHLELPKKVTDDILRGILYSHYGQ